VRVESPEASTPRQPAERGGHPQLAGGALACAQKKAEEEERTIIFVDESGFYLLPSVVRTFAPQGQTPVLRERLTNDHLSAISGVTPEGKLYMQVQSSPFRSADVLRFLRHLRRHLRGQALLLWDGAPIHRSHMVKEYLAHGAASWLRLERLPAYAPELNPDEGVWGYLKRVELKNLSCRNLPQLAVELRKAKERLRHKTDILRACCRRPGLAHV